VENKVNSLKGRLVTAFSRLSAILAAASILAACASDRPPDNRGRTGGRMDPSRDAASEVGSLDLRSADLVAATDRMAMDLASRSDINNPRNPPVFFIGPVINETSQPQQNYQIFVNRLRALLNAAASDRERHGLDIRQDAEFMERMRQHEYGTTRDPDTGEQYASPNEYVLTAIIHDLPSRGTNYYLIEYQLVQLKDFAESGPNRGPAAIIWSNFYEVKFQ
jgi:hypothetical protein